MTHRDIVDLLRNANGQGCECSAFSRSECGCDVEWASDYVLDAADEIEALRKEVDRWKSTSIDFATKFKDVTTGLMEERNKWRGIAKGLYSHGIVCHETHNWCAVDEYEEAMEEWNARNTSIHLARIGCCDGCEYCCGERINCHKQPCECEESVSNG